MIDTEHASQEGQLASRSGAASLRLQILTTEHWSLLSTRSLIYSESLSRVVMFLSILSAAVVALALMAQVDHLRETLTVAAILMLAVVLFVGVATVVRLSELNREDMRLVMGMNRLRRAYLDMHPELERYFLTGCHDDLGGLMLTLGMDMMPGRWSVGDLNHGFQTLPAMLGVIVAVVAGVLAALVAVWLGFATVITVVAAAGAFVASVVAFGLLTRHAFTGFARHMPTRFPTLGSR
jgi:hypothetical protein